MTQPYALFLADILEDAGKPADIAEKCAAELRRLHAQQGSEGERMTTLREAAQQALEALEGGADSWQLVGPAIDALKAALTEDAMQKFTDVNQELQAALGCDHCNSPLYAAVKCRVCGRVTEPVQEPVAWMNTEDGFCTLDSPVEGIDVMSQWAPLYAAPPQRHLPDWISYDKTTDVLNIHGKKYAAAIFGEEGFLSPTGTVLRVEQSQPETVTLTVVPQRKPLTEEEIDSIWDSEKAFADIYAIARAIERAHGIGGDE